MTQGEWIVPFKGRNRSDYFNQNFLWKTGNIYVMDNHRAALWCWLQHVKPGEKHSIFHIDQHYDTLPVKRWLSDLPDHWDMTIDEYLDRPFEDDGGDDNGQLYFRFDNYLSLHLHQFGTSIKTFQCATHRDGVHPEFSYEEIDTWELLYSFLDPQQSPWIMNIDLDYFFCDGATDDVRLRFMSDAYIKSAFSEVRRRIDDGSVAVTTIALSPEYCGGWAPAERAMKVAMKTLGIKFELPKSALTDQRRLTDK